MERVSKVGFVDNGPFGVIYCEVIEISEPASMEHLVVKKKIEETRALYGPDWLRCEAASVIEDILGLPPSKPFSSTPLEDICLQAAFNVEDNILITKAIIENCDANTFKAESCTEQAHQSSFLETQDKKSMEDAEMKETSPEFELIHESSEEVEGV